MEKVEYAGEATDMIGVQLGQVEKVADLVPHRRRRGCGGDWDRGRDIGLRITSSECLSLFEN